MNLLEVFFIVSGFIIFFLALDIARKEKFNALHFFVFIFIGGGLLVFTFFPSVLNSLGWVFGLQRWADVLVYGAIIFTIYMTLLLLSKTEANKHDTTRLVRELAILRSEKYSYSWQDLILVRVYNEAQVLKSVLENIFEAWYTNILIIDDGSSDSSPEIISNFSRKHSHIISLRHVQNRWWGAALETGFEYIRRYLKVENIITFDADGQHDIRQVASFLNAIKKYPYLQVIFGSRFLKNSGYENMPLMRNITLKLGRVFTYMMNWSQLSDPHNGFRLIKKEALSSISLTADSMAYASELIEQIMKQKIPHAEIPVHIHYSQYSLAKWQKSSNAIFIALHTIWSKFFK